MKSKRRGVTLIEVMVASVLTVMVLGTVVSTMLLGTSSWIRGTAGGNAEAGAQRAVRIISEELREAMAVTVDADGQGLSFRLPQVDVNGNFTAPPVWDNVNRRVQRNGDGTITLQEGAVTRVIARNVMTTDPRTGTAYRLFNAGLGTVTREIVIQVAISNPGHRNVQMRSRYRESIFLRNIPELIR